MPTLLQYLCEKYEIDVLGLKELIFDRHSRAEILKEIKNLKLMTNYGVPRPLPVTFVNFTVLGSNRYPAYNGYLDINLRQFYYVKHRKVNGSIDGFLGLIHNGAADTLALTVFQDDARREFFDFTKPLYFSYCKAFLNLPRDDWNKYFAFFQSYHYSAWIGIVTALLVQCALCIFVNRIEARVQKRDSTESVFELAWQMLRLQLMQSETLQHSLTAGKISMVIFSLIQCTVVMGVLSSYIFSNLVRPKPPIPFTTFAQFTSLVADGTLHLVEVTKRNVFYETVIHSNAADFTAMRKALESNPLRLGASLHHVVDMLDEPGAVLLRYEDEHLAFDTARKCNIYVTDMIFPPVYGHLVFRKGFPFMKQINEFITKEHWRVQRLWRKYLKAYKNHVACVPSNVEVIGSKYPYIGTAIALFLAEMLAIVVTSTDEHLLGQVEGDLYGWDAGCEHGLQRLPRPNAAILLLVSGTSCGGGLRSTSSCLQQGVQVLKLIADGLNLRIEPVIVPSEQPIIGGVSNKKIFVNIPQDNWNQYFAFFQSYQLTTWIGIAVALLVQCVLCVVINRIEAQIRKRESKESAMELVWQMLRLQLLQSKIMRNSSKAGKFSVVVFSLIQCTVIMGVLSSYIFSNLVRPKAHIPFKTFEQFTSMISDGTLHMVEITKHNVFYEAILNSNASDYTAMREALEKNPLRLGSSLKQVMAMMDEPGAVLLRSEDERISFELSRKCNIFSADTIFPPAYGYFVFKKGFPYVDRINKIIEKEHWRLRSLWRKYLEVYRGQIDCAPASTQVIGPKYPYFGTVVILLLVELVAIVIFFGEVIARYVKRLHWKQGRVPSATL
uniref:PBPb domain-containing protein n=1 Tax=Bursaphelenchus xylophilus TaxID=6326 RepID=A0A1I7SCN2_BURXY